MSWGQLSFRGQWCSLYGSCTAKEVKYYQLGSEGTKEQQHLENSTAVVLLAVLCRIGEHFTLIHSMRCSVQGLINFPLVLFPVISIQTSNYCSTESLPFPDRSPGWTTRDHQRLPALPQPLSQPSLPGLPPSRPPGGGSQSSTNLFMGLGESSCSRLEDACFTCMALYEVWVYSFSSL